MSDVDLFVVPLASGVIVAQLIFGWLLPDRVWIQMVHSHPWAAGFWWGLSRGSWVKPPWRVDDRKGEK